MMVNLILIGVTSPHAASVYETEFSPLYNVDHHESDFQRIDLDLELYNTKGSLSQGLPEVSPDLLEPFSQRCSRADGLGPPLLDCLYDILNLS